MFAHKARVPQPAVPASDRADTPFAPARLSNSKHIPAWAQRYEREAETLTPPATRTADHAPTRSSGSARDGHPLDRRTREQMHTRFGTQFDDVRLHTGPQAAASARAMNARAYTTGSDIVFAEGQHAPDTSTGQQLIAHELVHVMQQRTGAVPYGTIQRADDDDNTSPQVTIQDMFPFETGDRIELVNVIKPDMRAIMTQIKKSAKEDAAKGDDDAAATAAALEMITALGGLTGVVEEASADVFTVVFSSAISVPTIGDTEGYSLSDVRLKVQRESGDTFNLSISGKKGQAQERTSLFNESMKATKDSDGNVNFELPELPVVGKPQAVFSKGEGKTKIGAKLSLMSARLFEVRELEPAPEASSEQKQDVEQTIEEPAGARRQSFTLGAGFQYSSSLAPTLSAAWRYNFPTTGIFSKLGLGTVPSTIVGEIVQIPVQAQILYAPATSAVGTASTGVNIAAPSEVIGIPVNLRLALGVGGGTLAAKEGTGEKPTSFGLTYGVGAGVVLGEWVRIEVRWDRLQNFLPQGQSAHFFQGGIGAQF